MALKLMRHACGTAKFKRLTSALRSDPNQSKEPDNLTAVLKSCGNLVLEQRSIPKVKKSEVLLAIDSVGICRTDLEYWKSGRVGKCVLKKPLILGHAASGVVAEVGEGVDRLCVGNRVAIEPCVPCGQCANCELGFYKSCMKLRNSAMSPTDGNLTRYIKHYADFCLKIPPSVSMEEASLVELVACSCGLLRHVDFRRNINILILGAGSLGLATLMVAKALGRKHITCMSIDMKPDRLTLARELGSDKTLLVYPDESSKDFAKRVVETYDCMPELTVDCCGTITSTLLGAYVTKSGGNLAMVGIGADHAPLPLIQTLAREIRLLRICRFCNDYRQALSLITNGKLQLNRLVSHHFDLEDINEALQTAYERKPGTLKVMVHVQPRDKNNQWPFEPKQPIQNRSNSKKN